MSHTTLPAAYGDELPFTKGHGTENDFVVVFDPEGALDLPPALVAALCDRRAGIGADGLLRVVHTAAVAEVAGQAERAAWFMDYRNADGSVAEMCGNGVRVFVRYLMANGLVGPDGPGAVATRAGVRGVAVTGETITVDMGAARLPHPGWAAVTVDGIERPARHVDMGNPHAVVFVDDLAVAGELCTPPKVTPPEAYPHGVNVEFVVFRERRHIALRVHERGVGETRSCGTGACAAAVAAAERDGVAAPADYTVDVPGGRLTVRLAADGGVSLAGPAVLVAEGVVRLPPLRVVRRQEAATLAP